jgi:hypothetical protein
MFATHLGKTRFIFARDERQASDLFTLDLVVTAAPPSRFWCQEFPLVRIIEPHRSSLKDAFALNLEGIGVFQTDGSWRIYTVGECPQDP